MHTMSTWFWHKNMYDGNKGGEFPWPRWWRRPDSDDHRRLGVRGRWLEHARGLRNSIWASGGGTTRRRCGSMAAQLRVEGTPVRGRGRSHSGSGSCRGCTWRLGEACGPGGWTGERLEKSGDGGLPAADGVLSIGARGRSLVGGHSRLGTARG
jgi:hypothetical protein